MSGSQPLSGLRILVVEDDYFQAEYACAALQEAGATIVGPCSTAADALRLALIAELDCALLDIDLGGRLDTGTAEALLERGLPVVFITGHDPEIVPGPLAELPLILKPAPRDAIVAAVARAAGR